MKELQDIVKAFDTACLQNKRCALATVVKIEGSSYRGPGARMLITEDGQLTGAISGGCLEGDTMRKASQVIYQQSPLLIVYDTTDDDDNQLGIALGCNGIIYILLEPIFSHHANNPIALIKWLLQHQLEGHLVTHFSLANKRLVYAGTKAACNIKGLIGDDDIVYKEMSESLVEKRQNAIKAITNKNECTWLFAQFIPAPIHLVIAGAGNDVQPLVTIASIMGWHTTVIDWRKNYVTKDRFPNAQQLMVLKATEFSTIATLKQQTVLLAMTHSFSYDLAVLRTALQVPVAYLGILGPHKKLQLMVEALTDDEKQLYQQNSDIIYAPVGFAIGAETAEEIALSIIAEIKAVLAGVSGNSLKFQASSIHNRQMIQLA